MILKYRNIPDPCGRLLNNLSKNILRSEVRFIENISTAIRFIEIAFLYNSKSSLRFTCPNNC